jgi:TDG/mug DNA glycosylase family protein
VELHDQPTISKGFPPVAGAGAHVLILGSLPGQVSLARAQYYAQPRNAFWPIMGQLFGALPELPYAERLARLVARGVALWDVCAEGRRPGSLDQKIDHASVAPNDFAAFLAGHPHVALIAFNGAAAAALFRRKVAPGLPSVFPPTIQLPSTSPAHAAMPFERKLALWRDGLRAFV